MHCAVLAVVSASPPKAFAEAPKNQAAPCVNRVWPSLFRAVKNYLCMILSCGQVVPHASMCSTYVPSLEPIAS